MTEQRLLSALGLAQKAGKLASGDTAVQMAVKSGKAKFLLIAADAAENSRKNMKNMAESYGIPVDECASRELLGSAIGRAQRSAVAVLDKGFATMIKKTLENADKR